MQQNHLRARFSATNATIVVQHRQRLMQAHI